MAFGALTSWLKSVATGGARKGVAVRKITRPAEAGGTEDVHLQQIEPFVDHLVFADSERLLTGAGVGFTESGWKSCADRSVLRVAVEYRAAAGTREFVVALRAHDGRVLYLRIMEPDNAGQYSVPSNADAILNGNFKATGGGLEEINCRGMADYKLLCLPRAGGVAADAWGGVA